MVMEKEMELEMEKEMELVMEKEMEMEMELEMMWRKRTVKVGKYLYIY